MPCRCGHAEYQHNARRCRARRCECRAYAPRARAALPPQVGITRPAEWRPIGFEPDAPGALPPGTVIHDVRVTLPALDSGSSLTLAMINEATRAAQAFFPETRDNPCDHPVLRGREAPQIIHAICDLCGEVVNLAPWLSRVGNFLLIAHQSEIVPTPSMTRLFVCSCGHHRYQHRRACALCACYGFIEPAAPPLAVLTDENPRKFSRD